MLIFTFFMSCFFTLQSPDLHIFGSRSLCQVFFKQRWLVNSRDRWGCLFYILKLWTSDTLWFSKLHHQFSPGCSQWGQGCSAHIDLFNISHCMWLQTPIQKAVLSVLNRMQWVQASKPFLLITVDHMMFKVCCKVFWHNSHSVVILSNNKINILSAPLMTSTVCVYACVCLCLCMCVLCIFKNWTIGHS